eukprot:jgi/Hompol1/3472/HPOL_006554-RA
MYTAKAIRQVIGVTPKYFRCPFGDIDDRVRAVIKTMNLTIVMWNRDTGDTIPNQPILDVVKSWLAPGAAKFGTISLEHDLFDVTSAAAP